MQAVAPEGAPRRTLSMRSVLDAFAYVDELGPDATGELHLGGEGSASEGVVFVERGRVCWCAARGLSRRLGELLVEVAGLDQEEMEEHYQSCKAARLPLGEYLVRGGILEAEALELAILQHTTESLAVLCRRAVKGGWLARSGPGFSPRFTFTTAELFTRMRAIERVMVAEKLTGELGRVFYQHEWGAGFLRQGASNGPEPVALFGAYPAGATALLRAGKWAASALDIASVISGPDALVVAYSSPVEGSELTALIAYPWGEAMVVGETSSHGPVRILNRRARERKERGASDGRL